MQNHKLKISLTIFSMLFCFFLFAQGPPGGQGSRSGQNGVRGQQRGSKPDASEILSMLDTNNDDLIDKEEASKDRRGKISEDFDEIDANEDGFIDLEELKQSLNNRKPPKRISPEKILKEVDDNRDGTLNELEVAAKNKRDLSDNFKAIDANQDNEIDLEELKAFYASKEDRKKRKKRE